MIKIKNIVKTYNEGKSNEFCALKGVSLDIEDGESIAIVGQSGAGKTTLLNILRGQLAITKGDVYMDDFSFVGKKYNELTDFKRENIANIYQDYFLIDELSVIDNIELPLCIRKMKKQTRMDECATVIKRVGLKDMYNKKVEELSGGEKQRVAIARAIITGAKYIMADEPTGALDKKNSENIMDMLFELNGEGKTIIYVTHELSLAERAERIITISDGIIVSDERKEKITDKAEVEAIQSIAAATVSN